MLHADPHPGNFRVVPTQDGAPEKLGVLDFGAVARLPDGGLPYAMGALIRIAGIEDDEALLEGLRAEGFVKDRSRSTRASCSTTSRRSWSRPRWSASASPASGCAASSSASTTRARPSYTIAIKLNLPPAYLLIHRTWLGGIGILSQLEAEAPFRQILTESLPGFAEPDETAG